MYMKKLLKVLSVCSLTAAIAAASSVATFAAGVNAAEQKVLDELKTTVTMQGAERSLPSNYVNQAENYFNTVEMTEEQSAEIIKRIEAVKAYLTSTGAANYNGLTDAQIDTAVAKSQEVCDVMELTIAYDKATRVVSIIDKAGKPVFTATLGKKTTPQPTPGGKTDPIIDPNPIKPTGFDFGLSGVMAVAGTGILLVSAAGAYLFTTRKKTENA